MDYKLYDNVPNTIFYNYIFYININKTIKYYFTLCCFGFRGEIVICIVTAIFYNYHIALLKEIKLLGIFTNLLN